MTGQDCDVVIVGAGPAGLSAATALAQAGVRRVIVLEREQQAGGVPRHTEHLGYGVRDLHRVLTGPAYANKLRDRAVRAGVAIRTATTATDFVDTTSLATADPSGSSVLRARAVILATGVRERPRSARLIPGDRPTGVLTTGALQQFTALHHQVPGRRAIIVGAEHVSFSAVMTLRHAGCEVVAMVTHLAKHQTYEPLRRAAFGRRTVPIMTGDAIAAIHGRPRVSAVTLQSGQRIECDTVVFTGDWIPDHELARRGGIIMDNAHRGPVVDQEFRSNRPGVFAIGNLVHPAETADRCALDGTKVVEPVRHWLSSQRWANSSVAIHVQPPLLWVAAALMAFDRLQPPVALHLRVADFTQKGRLQITQGKHVLWTGRPHRHLVPNRSIVIPGTALRRANPNGEPIFIQIGP